MKIRALKDSDTAILNEIGERSGAPYPKLDHPHIELVLVVADEEDRPILAVAAKRMVEVFGWFSQESGAELRSEAINLIEGPMIETLKRRGYDCAEVFIPPQLERRGFGRILMEKFGWYRNWTSFGKRF